MHLNILWGKVDVVFACCLRIFNSFITSLYVERKSIIESAENSNQIHNSYFYFIYFFFHFFTFFFLNFLMSEWMFVRSFIHITNNIMMTSCLNIMLQTVTYTDLWRTLFVYILLLLLDEVVTHTKTINNVMCITY